MSSKIDVLKDLKWNSQLLRNSGRGFLIAGFIAATGVAVAQNSGQNLVPDAQVEANVLKALAGAPELAN